MCTLLNGSTWRLSAKESGHPWRCCRACQTRTIVEAKETYSVGKRDLTSLADHGYPNSRNSKLKLGKRRDAEIETLLEMFRTEKGNSAPEHARLSTENGDSALETDKRVRVLKTKSLNKRVLKVTKQRNQKSPEHVATYLCLPPVSLSHAVSFSIALRIWRNDWTRKKSGI